MPSGRRVHPLVPALVAALVAGVLVLVVAARDDDAATAPASTTTTTAAPTTTTSTTTTTPPEPVPVDELLVEPLPLDPPTSYRITYDVVENGSPRVEEWTVRRPYEAVQVATRDGSPLSGSSTSREMYQVFLSEERGWLPVQPELHRPEYDLRAGESVALLVHLGLAQARDDGEHAGRRCLVYRTGQPPTASEVTAPTDGEHTDLCIDAAGLVLHERWVVGGVTVVERTATSVELEPQVDAAAFQPGPVAADVEELARAFSSIAVEADAETLARLRTDVLAPEGYTADGAVFRAAGSGSQPGGASEIVRFFSAGPDLLEVAEVFVDGPATVASPTGVPVVVEGWDEVWFLPAFRASALRARIDESSYVEVRHHDVRVLVDVFRSLVRR
ncbi:MAG TPA: hypothetical protein VFV42_02390 [Acidimicrobiales bacterium]|nr:hypothetical protein [Acidimicrobiales bacterium]